MDEKICLTCEEIDNLKLEKGEKAKLINLIVYIYGNYKKDYLMYLIQGKKYKDYCRVVLDFLQKKELRLKDLPFKSEEKKNSFIKNIILISENKDEINFAISLSLGLTNKLKLIEDNYQIICKILGEKAGFLRSNELTLYELCKEDDIDEILKVLSNILKLTKDKYYKLLNLSQIFQEMVDFYSNRSLLEISKLYNIINILRTEKTNQKIVENFYDQIHKKGMNAIKNKNFKKEDIFYFIIYEDINSKNPTFNSNDIKAPSIYSYIQKVNDVDQNNIKNLEILSEQKKIDKERINQLEKILNEKNNKINELQNKIDELNKKNIDLLDKINQLEKDLNKEKDKEKDYKNQINQLNNKLTLKDTAIIETFEQIREKDKIIKQYELKLLRYPIELSEGEKIMTVHFMSFDEIIHYSIICKNTDDFSVLEKKFYKEYAEYKDFDNNFILNGRKINKNKSLIDNNIKDNDIIIVN